MLNFYIPQWLRHILMYIFIALYQIVSFLNGYVTVQRSFVLRNEINLNEHHDVMQHFQG